MDTMLAAVYHGPHDIRLEEVPVPKPGPGQAVMRVRTASICSTDLRIFNHGHFKIPQGAVRVLGHALCVDGPFAGTGKEARSGGQWVDPRRDEQAIQPGSPDCCGGGGHS